MPILNLTFDLATPAGLADLEAVLASRSYLVGYVAAERLIFAVAPASPPASV